MKKKLFKWLNLTLLLGLMSIESNAQVSIPTNIWAPGPPYVGWTTVNDLDFQLGGTRYMQMDGTINVGFIGIGTTPFTPSFKLDVDQGDININTATNSYRIGDGAAGTSSPVLWHNGITSNIYVGVNAGNTSTSGTNIDNTCVGYVTGNAVTTGFGNTLIGSSAGASVTSGWANIFVGAYAGQAATDATESICIGYAAGASLTGSYGNIFIGNYAGYTLTGSGPNIYGDNTFVGKQAGYYTTLNSLLQYSGSHNSFYGDRAGYHNTEGYFNTALGAYSMYGNQTGINNVYVGINTGHDNQLSENTIVGADACLTCLGKNNTMVGRSAGLNVFNGSGNIFIGYLSGTTVATVVDNSTAIGVGAEVVTDNTMILGDGANTVSVGIGISGSGFPSGPLGKLHVQRDLSTPPIVDPTAVYVENNDVADPGTYSGYGYGINVSTLGDNRGNTGGAFLAKNGIVNWAATFDAYGLVGAIGNQQNIGGRFTGANANLNYGLISNGMYGNQSTGGAIGASYATTNYAVHAYAFAGANTNFNYGIVSTAIPSAATIFNVAVYGQAAVNPPFPFPGPIGAPLPGTGTWAGYFNGDLGYIGSLGTPSDSAIKTNIQLFGNASSILNQINCYTYNYDTTKYGDHINLPKTLQIGFLAQEVESAAQGGYGLVINSALPPKLDSAGNVLIPAQAIKMIDYVKMVPLLQEGYREQQATIESLNTRITDLESIVQACCAANRGSNPDPDPDPNRTGQNDPLQLKLMNVENAILYTNEPNPYTSSTTIRYFIPENTSDVKITFQDATGKTLKEVKINETGQGSIVVDGSELINGIYTYSLVIGNKVVDTKKMVKQ